VVEWKGAIRLQKAGHLLAADEAIALGSRVDIQHIDATTDKEYL
jgi:hypothetical protein